MMANERSFATLGARAIDLRIAWLDRLDDARLLMAAGRFPSSIAMGLYALEILLKARICQFLHLEKLPKPFETHDLEGLLIVSSLRHSLLGDLARPVKTNWDKITNKFAVGLNDSRYLPNSSKSQGEAEEFFSLLNETTFGVIPWISRQP